MACGFFLNCGTTCNPKTDPALIHQGVLKLVSPGPDFICCMLTVTHAANKTSLSTMGAVSQWLCMDLRCELSHKGTSNGSSFPCLAATQRADLGTWNTQHTAWPQGSRWRSRNELPRPGEWQESSDQLSCSFTTHWLQ